MIFYFEDVSFWAFEEKVVKYIDSEYGILPGLVIQMLWMALTWKQRFLEMFISLGIDTIKKSCLGSIWMVTNKIKFGAKITRTLYFKLEWIDFKIPLKIEKLHIIKTIIKTGPYRLRQYWRFFHTYKFFIHEFSVERETIAWNW